MMVAPNSFRLGIWSFLNIIISLCLYRSLCGKERHSLKSDINLRVDVYYKK